jgi:phospholipid-binding lipoprotein MlaA
MRTLILCLAIPLTLLGCATPANHYDPLEPVNRPVYAFNQALDKAVVKPVARGYVAVTPTPVRKGVSNFFGNLEDVYIGVSDLLEGKLREAGGDVGRVLVNSTVGIAGLFDVASEANLPKHNADFGQVLGHWGVPSGPYIVMPVLGSKTLRDSADWAGGYFFDPVRALREQRTRNELQALKFVDLRASLLSATAVFDAASFGDEYSFVRDSYLQRRYSLIWDGNPPSPLKLGDDDADIAPSDEPATGQPHH